MKKQFTIRTVLLMSGLIVCCLITGIIALFYLNLLESVSLKTACTLLLMMYLLPGVIIWRWVQYKLHRFSRFNATLVQYQQDRLKESVEREKRFAANAAHELRTPMAAISTQAQLALQSTSEADRTHAIKKVLQGTEHCSHLIEQLLILSGILSESHSHKPANVDLGTQSQAIIADIAPFALEKNTHIEFIAPHHPVYVKGYRRLLSILLRNLMDNAIRHTPKNSLIQMVIETASDTSVILKVIDNGPGIPKVLRQQVFEPFFRGQGVTATGSGLGMAIIQQIIDLHQANISLHTPDSGRGLAVEIRFPPPDK